MKGAKRSFAPVGCKRLRSNLLHRARRSLAPKTRIYFVNPRGGIIRIPIPLKGIGIRIIPTTKQSIGGIIRIIRIPIPLKGIGIRIIRIIPTICCLEKSNPPKGDWISEDYLRGVNPIPLKGIGFTPTRRDYKDSNPPKGDWNPHNPDVNPASNPKDCFSNPQDYELY
jgi:hypothetical protein